ncbi:TPA: hypothetical protein ACGOU9_001330 [Streptococcus suis]
MSLINQLKSQSKTVLAAVAITAATVGFAGGMSVAKNAGTATTQSQAALAQNQAGAANSQANSNTGNQMPTAPNGEMRGMLPGQNGAMRGMPPGQNGEMQGMPQGRGGAMRGMPPGQNGTTQGIPSGQGTTPPNTTSGTRQSNTSSDEVNALKEKNQEIKAQISGSSSTSNQ